MKHYWSFGYRLPAFLAIPLFGDRKRFGSEIRKDDPDWIAWQGFYMNFYMQTQKQGIGEIVNDAGYSILGKIDLTNKCVLEIGPGILPHSRFWKGKPAHYAIVDNQDKLLDISSQVLEAKDVPYSRHLTNSYRLPFHDREFDVVISFYSLEHLYPLNLYLQEMKRVLRPDGILIGAIPAEGGFAWGLGRYLTSRRYIKKNASFDPDKIICWEHPNFAESILESLDSEFVPGQKIFWPLALSLIDLNLVISFVYRRGVNIE